MPDVEHTYDEIASEYSWKVTSNAIDHPYIERFLSLLTPGMRVLDVGAGTGRISSDMSENHQLDVTAIDVSKKMVAIAHKEHPQLHVLCMDMRPLNFPNATFDALVNNYSLIHIVEEQVSTTLAEMNRVLKPGGCVYFSLQESRTTLENDGEYPIPYRPEVKIFINLFSESEICSHLQPAGFETLWIDRREHIQGMEFPFSQNVRSCKKI